MIITFSQDSVDFWKERDFEPEERFRWGNYTYWNIDVPLDHPDLKDPAYIGIALKEQREFPTMIRERFAPPMYCVVVNRRVAMTPVKTMNGEEGESPMAMPISRSVALLREMFTKPDKKQIPKYIKLKRTNQIVNAMREVKQFGVEVVADVVKGDLIETFSLDRIATIIAPKVELFKNVPPSIAQANPGVQ